MPTWPLPQHRRVCTAVEKHPIRLEKLKHVCLKNFVTFFPLLSDRMDLISDDEEQYGKNVDGISMGINKLTTVTSTSSDGATVEIYLLGATVMSYKTPTGQEVLAKSSEAVYDWDGKVPIRGGIPIVRLDKVKRKVRSASRLCLPPPPLLPFLQCFPQFAAQGPLPMHGFARTSFWCIVEAVPGRIVLTLTDDENNKTKEIWPHAFALLYTVKFDARHMTTSLRISNPASAAEPFAFEVVLHTYLSLGFGNVTPAGSKARITGLKGLTCIAKPSTGYEAPRLEAAESLMLGGEIDRIFTPLAAPIVVSNITSEPRDKGANRFSTITVAATANVRRHDGPKLGATAAPLDVIVWNPGAGRSKTITDLGDDDWRNFVCVEPGRCSTFTADFPAHKALQPGEEWTITQTISLS